MSSLSCLDSVRSNRMHSAFVSTCVGVAICVGLYVIWGPEHFFRKKGKCPGLLNLGNSCFINSILQSIAALPEVRSWLVETAASEGGRLVQAISDILSALAEDSGRICSARDVLQALAMHRWRIDSQQQDAHEFYHILMSTLNEEIECPSLMDAAKESITMCNRVWSRAGLVPVHKKPTSPLRGMLSSELYCIKCNYSMPLKYESFESISLTLPQYKCTLENSLLEFIKSEVVHDVTCARCSKRAGRTVKQTHLKRLQLSRAPLVLCIHMNRVVWLADGSLVKNDHHMRFPVQLDASALLKDDDTSSGGDGVLYVLSAVVEHRGGPNSGHYITYRRCGHAGGSGWVYTSDTAVYSASLDEVLAAEAYILFYRRKREQRRNSNLFRSQ